MLTVSGTKNDEQAERKFLHQGIANRAFERRFNLAEHVEVSEAALRDGMLTVRLHREIPEAMKPRSVPISDGGTSVLEHSKEDSANVEAA